MEIHRPGAHPPVQGVILDGYEIGQCGVVHQHVHRAICVSGLLNQPLAVLGQRDVDRHRGRLSPGGPDPLHCLIQGAGQRLVVPLVQGPGGTNHLGPLPGKRLGYDGANAPAGAGYYGHLTIQLTHCLLPSHI